MKNLLVTISALIIGLSAHAQGTIQFSTFNSARGVNAPFYAPGGTAGGIGIGSLGTVNAQLFLVGTGGAVTALTPATTFNTAGGAASRYVLIPTSNVIVPGVPAGGSATVLMRAWMGDSYETATIRGQTAPLTVNNLGGIPPGGGAPLQPAVLAGLQGFEVFPEPSTLAFGLLGAAALLLRRRR
ncbi:MAG TPA: MYXO-CTERM sorting domain-containing protein [Verrucomicrobiae bacterium]